MVRESGARFPPGLFDGGLSSVIKCAAEQTLALDAVLPIHVSQSSLIVLD